MCMESIPEAGMHIETDPVGMVRGSSCCPTMPKREWLASFLLGLGFYVLYTSSWLGDKTLELKEPCSFEKDGLRIEKSKSN